MSEALGSVHAHSENGQIVALKFVGGPCFEIKTTSIEALFEAFGRLYDGEHKLLLGTPNGLGRGRTVVELRKVQSVHQ